MNHLLQKQYTAYMSSSIFWKVTCLVDGCVWVSNKLSLAFYIFFLADYRLCEASQLMITCFSDAGVKANFIETLFYTSVSTVKMLLGLRLGIICF